MPWDGHRAGAPVGPGVPRPASHRPQKSLTEAGKNPKIAPETAFVGPQGAHVALFLRGWPALVASNGGPPAVTCERACLSTPLGSSRIEILRSLDCGFHSVQIFRPRVPLTRSRTLPNTSARKLTSECPRLSRRFGLRRDAGLIAGFIGAPLVGRIIRQPQTAEWGQATRC